MTSMVQDHDRRLVATAWTPRLQILTVACSVVFTIGTALQAFVVVDLELLEHTMRLAGASAAQAERDAPGFLTGFRAVGCLFIVGNALGLLARTGWGWLFWLVLAVNAGQAAGVVMVPTEVLTASVDEYGVAGVLPSVVTDGGALLLALALLVSYAVFRAPWAQRRVAPRRG